MPLGRARGGANPLLDNLVSWWALDGNGNDSHGTNTLTANGSPTYTTGKVGQAASLVAASSQYFSRASNSTLQTGNINWAICAWVKLASKPAADMHIASKFGITANREFLLRWTVSDRFQIVWFRDAAGTATSLSASSFAAPTIGVWYFVQAWHDLTAGTLNICINNGTVDSVACIGGNAATGDFTIGARADVAAFWDGQLDNVAIWKRLLTTTEKTELYNAGAGIAYPG